MRRRLWGAAVLALSSLLGACQTAPTYVAPTLQTPAPQAFKETGPWTPAAPADDVARGDWWTLFDDPVLTELEGRIEHANPSLAAALARYDQARALLAQARAGQFPEFDASTGVTGQRLAANRPLGVKSAQYADVTLGGALSYEFDLWGRVRNLVAAGRAEAQATAADVGSTRLSLQAQLADAYMSMRSLDAQARLLDETSQAYARALQLIETRHTGGIASGLDVGRAQTQLSTARAAQRDIVASRALYEHAIASLVGEPASGFAVGPVTTQLKVPVIPVSAPSTLLQRRPDVAAAERRTYEANRQIGVARAAFFPTITLGGTLGLETAGQGALFSGPSTLWSLGPGAVLPLFDAGRRRAVEAQARAQFAEAGDNYRQVALTAFQQVEDNLALANRLAEEATEQADAVAAAQKTQNLSMIRYRQGAATYLDVVTAQTAALEAERAALVLDGRRLQAGVDLVRALGGGWTTAQLTQAGPTAPPRGSSLGGAQ